MKTLNLLIFDKNVNVVYKTKDLDTKDIFNNLFVVVVSVSLRLREVRFL